jgi:Tfp pilus assembly protein PilF
MMKRLLCILAVLALTTAGCSGDFWKYNDALDGDRNAWEKMTLALNLMAEAESVLQDEENENRYADAEQKYTDALAAYLSALESWAVADSSYEEIIRIRPNKSDYYNNWGNSIYRRALCGLEVDLDRARELIDKAIELEDRPIFRRNHELIDELSSNEATAAQVAENRRHSAALEELREKAKLEGQ